MNKLENCIEKLNHEDKLWIKYFKKGKVFARYGVFYTFKDGVFTLVADSLKRSILLISAITIHNIPDGMAVGVAFGGIASGVPGMTLIGAVMLALGIGIQNFPEGAAVSLPLRNE